MSGNFLEHYAASWNRSIPWADRRLRLFGAVANFLSDPETAEMLREWAEDRGKMLGRKAREAVIASGEFTYWQGASQEAALLVDNLLAEVGGARASQENFERMNQAEAEKENEY